VLWKTAMPAVLIELGYLTHHKEEKTLANKEGQDKLAKSILKAISRYKDDAESGT
jgi:N-acetylmuramoyl-L-alanine amidase